VEKKEVAIDNPVTIAGLTLVPVVQILLSYWHGRSSSLYSGTKQPVALVIVSPSAKRAFRITGEEISIDQLFQEAPEIEEMLERI
jgi:uncharacterized spore protein YtfJ